MNYKISKIQEQIDQLNSKGEGRSVSEISDGYHSFEELYEFRKLYNAALFNEWARITPFSESILKKDGSKVTLTWNKLFDGEVVKFDVHKSWKHHDGELCFGGGWFIVVAMLPTGQISNHYREEDWDLFKVPEVPVAKYPYDGHTAEDVKQRLRNVLL